MKRNKGISSIIFGAAMTIITIFLLGVLFIYLFVNGTKKNTSNIKRYDEIFELTCLHSGLQIFPDSISESAADVNFKFSFADKWNEPQTLIYLQYNLPQNEYENELARLDSVYLHSDDVDKYLLYDECENYKYPAYVAIGGLQNIYEYVLLSGDNQLTYIYLSNLEANNLENINEYLPYDFDKTEKISEYSIYYEDIGNGAIHYNTGR